MPDIWLRHCPSERMCADIVTKAFPSKDIWTRCRQLIGICDEDECLGMMDKHAFEDINDKPRSFWERDENKVPKGKLDTLSPLQESCHESVAACVAVTESLYAARSTKAKPASISSSHVRKLVEVCCAEDSNMGVRFAESQGCRHVRITVKGLSETRDSRQNYKWNRRTEHNYMICYALHGWKPVAEVQHEAQVGEREK